MKSLIAVLLLLVLGNSIIDAADITWTNASDGNWSVAANWSPNQVPGSSDNAIITNNGTYTISLDSSATINSLILGGGSGTQSLSTAGNSLSLGHASAVNSNGVLNIGGNVALYGALTNQGTVNWQAGQVSVNNYSGAGYTGAIWNEANALWNIQCDQTLANVYSTPDPLFHNSGTLLKIAGSGTTLFNLNLDDSGTVEAQSGTIQFNYGGTVGGRLIADTGATLDFASILTPIPGFTVSGSGTLTLASMTIGTSFTLTNAVTVGNLTINAPLMVGDGGVLSCAGGGLNSGQSLTIANNGVLNIGGNVALYGTLTNQGTVNWQAGQVSVNNYSGAGYYGEIWNEANALWNIQCDQTLANPYSTTTPLFHNAGTLLKSAGSGTTIFNLTLDDSGTVEAQSGTIQFNYPATQGGKLIADTGATLDFASILTPIPGFTVSGSGTLTLASMTIGTSFTLTNAVTVGNLTINAPLMVGDGGVLSCAGGGLNSGQSLTIASNGVLNIEGAFAIQSALTNQGTVNWQAGQITVYYNLPGLTGAIWNEANALWNIQCDQTLNNVYSDPDPLFHNAGTLLKSAGTATTMFNLNLDDSGTVEAQSGTIQFNYGGTVGGRLIADTGATLDFASVLTPVPGFAISGSGTLTVASMTIGNSFTLNNKLTVGNLTINAPLLVGDGGVLSCSAGQISQGQSLTIASNGVLNIEGAFAIQSALTNQGTVNWQAGQITVYYNLPGLTGAIWNEANALWNIQCDQTLNNVYSDPDLLFHNAGTLLKSAGSGTTLFNLSLDDSGTVEAQSGTIQFNYPATLGGRVIADAGATVDFAGGIISIPGFTVSGNGTLTVAGMTIATSFTLTNALTVGNLTVNAPLVVGDGGVLNCAAGQVGQGQSLTIASNGVLNIEGIVTLYGALTNQGTVNWQAGQVTVNNNGSVYTGAIWNEANALWNIQCDRTLANGYSDPDPLFHNAGTLLKSAGSGTTTFNTFLNNTGVMDAESGVMSLNDGIDLTGGRLSFGISNLTSYGQINVSGNAALAGSFNVNLNDGFVPTNNSSFQVLTFGSSSGGFTNATGAAPPIWETNFTSTAMTLTTVSTITWPTPTNITYGTALGSDQLNASAGVPGTYGYSPAAGTVLESGSNQILTVTFTPSSPAYLADTLQVPLNVLKAPLSITASNQSKVYGQTVTFSGTEFAAAGLVNGDTATSVTLTSGGGAATALVASSPYAIVPSAVVGDSGLTNYAITYIDGAFTVSPAPLTITASSRSKTYGQTVTFAGTEFTPSGLLNSDTATGVTLASPGAAATSMVAGSPYAITPSAAVGNGLGNYTITYANGSLTVNPAPLTVKANNRTKSYGQSITFAGTEFTPTGLVNADSITTVTLTSSGAPAAAVVSGSPYSIVPSAATGTGLGNYTISYANGALTVNPASLTITANSQSKTYGQTTTFAGTEFTPAGLQNSETVGSVTLTSSGAAATATVPGSPYNIVPSGATGGTFAPGNYTVAYANGALTVNPAPLTITATNRAKTYGQTVTFAGTEFTASGLLNSDTATSVNLSSGGAAMTATVSGSPYSIVPGAAAGSGLGNYAISYVNGILTVNRASLTITAANHSKTYGQTVTFAGTEFTPTGLLNSDTATSATFSSIGAASAATVSGSPYGITPSAVTGTGIDNYTVSYVNGTMTVNPATLTITASNRSKTYGQTVTFAGTEFTPSGLQNSETIGSVTLISAGASATAPVSGSPNSITPSAATGGTFTPGNYTVSYVNGAMTINPATLTITASNRSKTYGQSVTFAGTEFSAGGLVNADTVTGVTLASSGAASNATVPGSPYTIAPSAAVGTGLANYAITYANGTLTVNPAALTITATNENKYFGQTVTFTGHEFAAVGLTNSETIGSVTLSSSGAPANASPGLYPIIPSNAAGGTFASGNYAITYANGSLTVNALPTLQLSVQGASLMLSWSTNAVGFSLQATTNLSSSANWTGVFGSAVVGNQNVVVTNLSGASAFFRLKL